MEQIQQAFFALKTWGQLRDFMASLDPTDPFQAALRHYASTWAFPANPEVSFEPHSFISSDLSATYFHRCPVIFEGSNQWAQKPYFPREDHDEKLNAVYARCEQFRRNNPESEICLILVPEKDFVISYVFLRENRFCGMIEAIQALRAKLGRLGIPLIFEQPVMGLGPYMSIDDYEYPDSHLHARNYILIFSHAVRALGHDWDKVSPFVTIESMPIYFDLSAKFKDGKDRAFNSFQVSYTGSAAMQVSGSEYFEAPLRQTTQTFENSAPVFDEEVLLLGDSHSSIFTQRRLTYLFANSFRKTKFSWNPIGNQPEQQLDGSRKIVLEVSSRFVF